MTTVYYSSVFDHPCDDVWSLIRDFNNYPAYIDGVTESQIEDDKSGDAVGAMRCFVYRGLRVRQRLLAHSDLERSFTYGSCEPLPFPGEPGFEPIHYQGTLQVTPVTDTGRSFVEWSVTFESGDRGRARWTAFLEDGVRQWTASLGAHVAAGRQP